MPSAKEQIAKIFQDQPDDSSYDEILRELAFARMVEGSVAKIVFDVKNQEILCAAKTIIVHFTGIFSSTTR